AVFFFFQAEDGIRDFHVTGVQTCALPIYGRRPGGLFRAGSAELRQRPGSAADPPVSRLRALRRSAEPARRCAAAGGTARRSPAQIGRASCRESGKSQAAGGVSKTTLAVRV